MDKEKNSDMPDSGNDMRGDMLFPAEMPEEWNFAEEAELFANMDAEDEDVPGEDMIFLDKNCYLVDGADDSIDFMVADGSIDVSLSDMLANGDVNNPRTFNQNRDIPMVRDVEVLLKGDVADIRQMDDLPRLNISFDRQGQDRTLKLGKGWEKTAAREEGGSFPTEIWAFQSEDGAMAVTLETTLEVRADPAGAEEMLTARTLLNDGNV